MPVSSSNERDKEWMHHQKIELRFQTRDPNYARKVDQIDETYIAEWRKWVIHILLEKFEVVENQLWEKDIVEIGCGARGAINVINGTGRRAGIDPLFDKLRAHQTLYESDGVEFYTEKAEETHFEDASFDVVLCINTLDHVQDIEKTLFEMYRMLKSQGALLLAVHTFEFLSSRLPKWLLRKIDPPHPHHFSHREVLQKISSSGFRVLRYKLDEIEMHYGSPFKRFIVRMFGRTLWAVVSKPTMI